MATSRKAERPPASNWQTEMLRLTAFPSPTASLTGHNWWMEVVGEAPETRTSQPRTGEQEEQGPFGNGKLVLRVHPLRIDWHYSADKEIPSKEFGFPTVGAFLESLDVFRQLMHTWLKLESSPSLVRIAFGAVLLQPVEDLSNGYELLSSYLPFKMNFEGSSDFLYQINRPRDSNVRISNLKINRLSKWSVASFQSFLFPMTPMLVNTLPIQQSQPALAARLELDINTVPDFGGEFNRDLLPELFDELVNLGTEIAQEGDIP